MATRRIAGAISRGGYGDATRALSVATAFDGDPHSLSVEIHQLSARRDRLLGEIQDQENVDASDTGRLRLKTAAVEALEKERTQTLIETRAECSALEAQARQLASALGPEALRAVGSSRAEGASTAAAELALARQELEVARAQRAELQERKVAASKEKLHQWVEKIRSSSQENQSLQANQQMAEAHLKALEAMAASSVGQIQAREHALYGFLRQMEEQEALALNVANEERSAEQRLEGSSIEAQQQEAVAAAEIEKCAAWSSEQRASLEEAEAKYASLSSTVASLQCFADSISASTNHRELQSEVVLRHEVSELHAACDSTANAARSEMRRQPLLEDEAKVMAAEIEDELRAFREQEHLQGTLGKAWDSEHAFLRTEVSELEAELSSSTDLLGPGRLFADERRLSKELAEFEMRCGQLRQQAAEHEKEFEAIERDLQKEVNALEVQWQHESEAQATVQESMLMPRPDCVGQAAVQLKLLEVELENQALEQQVLQVQAERAAAAGRAQHQWQQHAQVLDRVPEVKVPRFPEVPKLPGHADTSSIEASSRPAPLHDRLPASPSRPRRHTGLQPVAEEELAGPSSLAPQLCAPIGVATAPNVSFAKDQLLPYDAGRSRPASGVHAHLGEQAPSHQLPVAADVGAALPQQPRFPLDAMGIAVLTDLHGILVDHLQSLDEVDAADRSDAVLPTSSGNRW